MKYDVATTIFLFIFFFFPGFVSLKIWQLFYDSKQQEKEKLIFDCIFLSIINFGFLAPLSIYLYKWDWPNHPVWTGLFVLLYCIIGPIIWPCLWHWLRNKKYIYKYIDLAYPSAWDYFVHQKQSCFMIIHLKDDSMIGGYFGENSYASAYSDKNSIYLEKAYKINPDGTFGEQITDSFGLVISEDNYKFIEFFHERKDEDDKKNDGHQEE
jgi:hypothetical protein